MDPSWVEDEAEGQQHRLETDEGIKFEILPKSASHRNDFQSGTVGVAVSRRPGWDRRPTF